MDTALPTSTHRPFHPSSHAPFPTPRPLPLRLTPQPGEALSSFLVRTARLMHYEQAQWILQPELLASPLSVANITLLWAQEDYDFLGTLLALSEEQLYAMTIHPFDVLAHHLLCFRSFRRSLPGPSLPPPSPPAGTHIARPTLSRQIAQFTCFPTQTTQICPLCLLDPLPFDRLYWHVKYLLTCPSHRCFLLRSCPQCSRPISSLRMDPLACHICSFPYPQAVIPVPDDLSFLLHDDLLTFRALGVDASASCSSFPPITSSAEPFSHDPRTQLPPAQYLALLRALSLSMRPLLASDFLSLLPPSLSRLFIPSSLRPYLKPLSPQRRLPPLHIATAHWIFSRWPDHFFSFLSTLTTRAHLSNLTSDFVPAFRHSFSPSQAPDAYRLLSTTPPTPSHSSPSN